MFCPPTLCQWSACFRTCAAKAGYACTVTPDERGRGSRLRCEPGGAQVVSEESAVQTESLSYVTTLQSSSVRKPKF